MVKPPEKSQIEKFREAAAAFEADTSSAEYEAAVITVATAPKLTDEEIKAVARRLRRERANPSPSKGGQNGRE